MNELTLPVKWTKFDPKYPPADGWYLVYYYDVVDDRNSIAFAYWNNYDIFGPQWMIQWIREWREGVTLYYTDIDQLESDLEKMK